MDWLPNAPFPFLFIVAVLVKDFLVWCIGHASTLTLVGSTEMSSAYLRLTVTLLQQEAGFRQQKFVNL